MACKGAILSVFAVGALACAPKCPKPALAGASSPPAATLLEDGRVRLADGREVTAAEAAASLPPGAALVFAPPAPPAATAAEVPGGPSPDGSSPAPPPVASGPAPAPSAAVGPTAPPSTEPTAPVAGSLPEVVVSNVGLHIGGGPNDDASKAPFRAAIEKRFEDLRKCYVHAEEPEKGGTYGVDLFIGRNGGNPELRQPRTGMKGAAFRDCIKRAFSSVVFGKPPRGPTVISYSVRFKLK